MKELLISGTDGCSGLLFYGRQPQDPTEEIISFWIRLSNLNLSAAANISGEEGVANPAELFEEMAQKWSGWPGKLAWHSFLGELSRHCSHDRRGHITIEIELLAGDMIIHQYWFVKMSVKIEAGQLEPIARKAKQFFGREWESRW